MPKTETEPMFRPSHYKNSPELARFYREFVGHIKENLPKNGTKKIAVSGESAALALGNVLGRGEGVTEPLKTHEVVHTKLTPNGIPKAHENVDALIFEPPVPHEAELSMLDYTGLVRDKEVKGLMDSISTLVRVRDVALPLISSRNQLKKDAILVFTGVLAPRQSAEDYLGYYETLTGLKHQNLTRIPKSAFPERLQKAFEHFHQKPLIMTIFRRPKSVIADDNIINLNRTKLNKRLPEVNQAYETALKKVRDHLNTGLMKTMRVAVSQGRRLSPEEREILKRVRLLLKEISTPKQRLEQREGLKAELRRARVGRLVANPGEITEYHARQYGGELKTPTLIKKLKLDKTLKAVGRAEEREPTLKLLEELNGHINQLKKVPENVVPLFNGDALRARRLMRTKAREVHENIRARLRAAEEQKLPDDKMIARATEALTNFKTVGGYMGKKGGGDYVPYAQEVLAKPLGRRARAFATEIEEIKRRGEAATDPEDRAKAAKEIYFRSNAMLVELEGVMDVTGKIPIQDVDRFNDGIEHYWDWADANGYSGDQYEEDLRQPRKRVKKKVSKVATKKKKKTAKKRTKKKKRR